MNKAQALLDLANISIFTNSGLIGLDIITLFAFSFLLTFNLLLVWILLWFYITEVDNDTELEKINNEDLKIDNWYGFELNTNIYSISTISE